MCMGEDEEVETRGRNIQAKMINGFPELTWWEEWGVMGDDEEYKMKV